MNEPTFRHHNRGTRSTCCARSVRDYAACSADKKGVELAVQHILEAKAADELYGPGNHQEDDMEEDPDPRKAKKKFAIATPAGQVVEKGYPFSAGGAGNGLGSADVWLSVFDGLRGAGV